MYKNSFVHYLTKILVDIMFYGGILCCIAASFITPKLVNFFGYNEAVIVPFTVILLLSGICSLFILWQLKAMFKTLLGGNPFVTANVNCLRKCAVAGFSISIIYIVTMCFGFGITGCVFNIMAAVIVTIFSLLGLFCLTLKDIFKQAIAYKEENDWTV